MTRARFALAAVSLLAPFSVMMPASTRAAAPEDLKVLEFWQIYSDTPNALYKVFASEALDHLRRRTEAVARLHTQTEWSQRQKEMRGVLQDLVGPFPERTPLNARVVSAHQKDGYRIENVIYESQPGLHVTASLYLPDGRQQPAPAILYCSGHSIPGYRNDVYQHKIVNLARKGFIVLAFDPIGQGERLQYFDPATGKSKVGISSSIGHIHLGPPAFVAGSPLSRHMIWDGIRSVDYLLTRPEVDPARLGITGRSGGGTQTCYIAALDDRLLAAAPECYVTTFEHLLLSRGPQDAEQNFHRGIARGLDQPDFLMLRAPKPALIIATTRDIFSYTGTLAADEEVRRAYAAFGQEGQLRLASDDADHESTRKNREAMYAFFQDTLELPGDPADEEVELPRAEELRVTETGQVSVSLGDKGVPELVRREAERLAKALDRRRADPATHLPRVRAAAIELSGHRTDAGYERSIYSGTYQRNGYVIDKHLIAVDSTYAIPVLIMRPDKATARGATLYLHSDGMAVAAAAGGWMEQLVRKGHTVVAVDVLGTGELSSSSANYNQWFPGASMREWFGFALIGRSVVAAQAADVLRALRFIHDQLGVPPDQVSAVAHGPLGAMLLHVAALEPAFTAVALIEPLVSYRELVSTRFYQTRQVAAAVPSALTAYDLPDLAASLSPRRLLILNPADATGGPADSKVVERDVAAIRVGYAGATDNFDLRQGLASPEAQDALVNWLD